jgi:hypothetical protein
MLQIDESVLSDVVVTPSSLALGEIESGSATRRLKIRLDDADDDHGHRWCRHGRRDHDDDDDDGPVTYTLGHQGAISTGANTFTPQLFATTGTVAFSQPTVTVGGGHRHDDVAFVDVTITPPGAASAARIFGGYITLTPDDGGPVLRVPYTGYNGDYQAIQVMTLAGFPLLAKLSGANFVPQPSGATFTLVGNDLPFILFHLNHQVEVLKMEVFDVATGDSVNFADHEKFVGRNSAANSFFAFAWDGTTFRRPNGRLNDVPNGTYRIDLTVLKALGNPRNPAHLEIWSSPNITIARP